MGRPSWPVAAALALLAAPRVLLHDLEVIGEGTFPNLVLVVLPLVGWFVAILLRRWSALAAGLRIGLLHGLVLAVVHQLTWSQVYAGDPPRLGDALADVPAPAQEAIFRVAAVASSLVTGLVVAFAVAGLAWLCRRLRGSDHETR